MMMLRSRPLPVMSLRPFSSSSKPTPGLVYPGSGIYFWWQAGATRALATRFDLSRAQYAGTSGGSLAATLAACGVVDSVRTFDVAWRLCDECGAFQRGPFGLYAIWGGIVREWLDEILPEDAHFLCRGRVNVLVRQPFAAAVCVNDFDTRADLIDACLASAHVPFFMDGAPFAYFRGGRYIDDDFLGVGRRGGQPALTLPEWAPFARIAVGRDPRIREMSSKPGGTMALLSRDALLEVIEWGAESVAVRDADGDFEVLEPLRIRLD